MDLTGSIDDITYPLSSELYGSVGGATGSSFIDTLIDTAFFVPNSILNIIGGLGADLGSTHFGF